MPRRAWSLSLMSAIVQSLIPTTRSGLVSLAYTDSVLFEDCTRAHDRGCASPRLQSDLRWPCRRASGTVRGARRAAAGQPGIFLISGEAGVGKSRLLTELTTLSAGMGATAVGGLCVDVAAGTLPYAPFVDIVRDLHCARFDGGAARISASRARTSRSGDRPARGDRSDAGQGGQGRLFAAVRDLLAVASTSRPILVTIEDLHWATRRRSSLVTYLARSMQSEHYLLVATARLETLPRRHPLLELVAELARLPTLDRIDLARFDRGELVQQLTGILGRVPDPDLAREVFERSDGNAFFAEELVATDSGGGGPLPASLHEVLAARLATLDEVTQGIVRVTAVAGRVVSHELLEQVAGMPSPVLISALRAAVDHGVLLRVEDPSPGYAFRHALAREAASGELLEAERIAIHRAIADALERDEALSPAGELARTGEIAYHALAANDLSRALTASLAAVAVAEGASAARKPSCIWIGSSTSGRGSPTLQRVWGWIMPSFWREPPAPRHPQAISPARPRSLRPHWPGST